MRIYCSGPLFCAEEVGGMAAIAQVVEAAGHTTFLPHRDGLEAYLMRLNGSSFASTLAPIRTRIDHAIFALDVYELVQCCDAVVCNLNGRVPDEGMIVEAAIAYAAGKPLVLYKDDARAPFGGYDNSMLTSLTRGQIVHKLAEIPAAVARAVQQVGAQTVTLSAELQQSIAYGQRIAAGLSKVPASVGKKQWSEVVLKQVLEAGGC